MSNTQKKVGSDAGSHDERSKKRRRKEVRNCLFCRKRKLKCDRAKPKCSQCRNRNLPTCLYTNRFNFDISDSMTEIFQDTPNVDLLKKISTLEDRVKELEQITNADENHESKSRGSDSSVGRKKNPLLYLRSSRWINEQHFIFGPTSWKTMLSLENEKFQLEFISLWDMFKPQPTKGTESSTETVASTTEKGVSIGGDIMNRKIFLNTVCEELPDYKTIETCLRNFFSGPLHELLYCLDEKKTMRDFRKCFFKDPHPVDPKHVKIIGIVPDDSLAANYYKIGIILLIVGLVLFNKGLPRPIKYFFHIIGSLTKDNHNFTERPQFLLLRCFNKICNSQYSCWDGSQVRDLMAELSHSCFSIGLDNVDKWFKSKENIVGHIDPLRNTFIWTLYTDTVISFDLGKPLFVSNEFFDMTLFLENGNKFTELKYNSNSNKKADLIEMYILVGREALTRLNSATVTCSSNLKLEDMNSYINKLKESIHKNFPTMGLYTKMGSKFFVDPFEIIVLAPTLGMILNFENIKRSYFGDVSIKTKNSLVKAGLLSLSLCVNTILSMYDMDRRTYRDIIEHAKYLSPYLNLSLALINPLFIRSLSEMYGLFFARLTMLEKGYLVTSVDVRGPPISLDDLEITERQYYSFIEVITQFRDLMNQLYDKDLSPLHRMMQTSYPFLSVLALERVGRHLFLKGLESRNTIEVNWHDQGINLDDATSEILRSFTNEVWNDYISKSQNMWAMKPDDFLSDLSRDAEK
ncbi:Pdr8p KNAG_0F02830 [Huiozyma naganishii CBS 8797]|uniref:Zn(2)-C6 fungal-type domain-containing protein n=1 Tax=Huiozyma naganishii (strain ATCC MYA-139 / BCRC 22969 / CBS 8797 / KCTC 17520 / NBRC 10181 / NCYC 3082 / Yp74L-3) TaxID=1071383 RepID=J7R7V1_HUIN7|nr:hypothetical protein KNAG_0F02830 [Kazachstania naganishii CBS 8797]CCK70945.1 hypothetical protein KNAG_0F02830 [Kazachstania naganishii CBS 8797]